MAGASIQNPHLEEPRSSVQTLTASALRRFGDFAPGSVSGDVGLMFLEFANLIIEDIRAHPYWPKDQALDYYTHPTDKRPIPDDVVTAGLLAHYAIQQGSEKAQVYLPLYYRTLNARLWQMANGNTPIRMRPYDVASDTNPTNGQPE